MGWKSRENDQAERTGRDRFMKEVIEKMKLATKGALRSASWGLFVGARRAKIALGRTAQPAPEQRYPERQDGKVLIHLGCGAVDAPGFINVDAKPAAHVHHCLDVRDLAVFESNSADLIYACHVLEHFPEDEQRELLWEWKRVLKPSGVLRLSVPDFDLLLAIYNASNRNVKSIVGPLMGYDDGYRGHCYLFNEDYLCGLLIETGFAATERWAPDTADFYEFEDWASKKIIRDGQAYPISLNIEGTK